MGAIDRWLALSSSERRAVARFAPTVALAVAYLRWMGAKRTLAWATPAVRGPAGRSTDDVALAVTRAARYVPGVTCLAHSAALCRVLRRNGVAANVRIGVVTDPAFAAHAWVEVDGEVLGHRRYAALPVRSWQ